MTIQHPTDRPPPGGPGGMLVHHWSLGQRERGRRSGSSLRRRPRGERRNEDLRRRWSVAQRFMRANGIVVAPPAFDHDPGLVERVEDLAVEQLVAQAGVEAFDIAILPRAAGGIRAPEGRDMTVLLGAVPLALLGSGVILADVPAHRLLSYRNCPPGLAKKDPPCVPPGLAKKGVGYDEWVTYDDVRLDEIYLNQRREHVGSGAVLDIENLLLSSAQIASLYSLRPAPAGEGYALIDGQPVQLGVGLQDADMLGNGAWLHAKQEQRAGWGISHWHFDHHPARALSQYLARTALAPVTAIGWDRKGLRPHHLAPDAARQPEAVAADPAQACLVVVGRAAPAARRRDDDGRIGTSALVRCDRITHSTPP